MFESQYRVSKEIRKNKMKSFKVTNGLKVVSGINRRAFCRDYGIHASSFSMMMNGKIKKTGGWSLVK